MQAVIASIPHTGTHFLMDLLRKRGWQGLKPNGEPNRSAEHHFYQGHILDKSGIDQCLALSETRPMAIPMRHPYLVEETWKRRARNLDDLEGLFHILVKRFSHGYLIPLDAPGRDERLRAFADAIGVDLGTDWSIVHSLQGTAYLDPNELNPSPGMRRVVNELFPDFYGGDLGKTARKDSQ